MTNKTTMEVIDPKWGIEYKGNELQYLEAIKF